MSDAVSTDGSPVEVYSALPAEPELSVVRRLLRGRVRVLDLGCGTGRIADPLSEDGHHVVAVDESEQMLQRVRLARAVRSSIEHLDLGRAFDAILMLSHLINAGDAPVLLAAAARHLADDGIVLLQRLEPGRSWQVGSALIGPVRVALVEVSIDGRRVSGTTKYSVAGRSWTQRWVSWDPETPHFCRTPGLYSDV